MKFLVKKIVMIGLISGHSHAYANAPENWICVYGERTQNNNYDIDVRLKSRDILKIDWKDYSGGHDFYKISKNDNRVLLAIKIDGDGLDNPPSTSGYFGVFFINKRSGLWVSRVFSLSDGYMDEARGYCKKTNETKKR